MDNKPPMDNKAYLDQIAVKGKVKKSGPVISPVLIKLIAAGVIMLITLAIVGSIINSSNAKVTQTFERVYVRINNLASETGSLKKYSKLVRESNLRSYANNLSQVLMTTKNDLSGVIGATGVKTSSISSTVSTSEAGVMAAYTAALDDAILTGTLDHTFANETSYQISTLIQYETESLKKTNNQQYANLINKSIQDLTIIQEQFMEWSNNH